jgi:anti-sigma B factor antagonist
MTPTMTVRPDLSSPTTTPDGRADWVDSDGADFDCRVVSSGNWVVLTLAGELDMAHAAEVGKALLELHLRRGARLALDLHDLSFMDSTGVRLVLQALRHAEALDADFAVIPGTGAVYRVLELVGLAEQLPLVDGVSLLR